MKPPPFDYYAPSTIDEAIAIKADLGSEAIALAGGQSLMPMLNMRLARPAALIDLNRIDELRYIRQQEHGIAVGAMTRQRDLERSEVAEASCPLVCEALRHVAHAIIRNRGTIGGSIAHADCAAELPAVLVALGGSVTAVGPAGTRTIAADDFFIFHLTTALAPEELLVEIVFPSLPAGAGWAFLEMSRRHGDFALAGVAARVASGASRMAFFGVGTRPILVEGDDPSRAATMVDPPTDIHAASDYRRHLVGTLAERALIAGRERARAREA